MSKHITAAVEHEHPSYEKFKPRWVLIEDSVEGDETVKDKTTIYLPQPNPTDRSDENTARYKQYVQRAVFYNVTARTLSGLVGEVFAKEVVSEIPSKLAIVEEDADGSGVSLKQQSKSTLASVMSKGRAGLFVDYPIVEGAATQQQLNEGTIAPTIIRYEPEQIINWRSTRIGSKNQLSLVVIREDGVEVLDDGFREKLTDRFRVLKMVDGFYVVELHTKKEDGGDYEVVVTQPKGSSAQPLTEIPFTFIGVENNDPIVDLPPMYDLAVLNIAHFRNSADYEESVFIQGQPTPWLAGLTEDWVNDVLKGSIQLGARAAIPLPAGGTAGLLQAEANTMIHEAMESKERQMVSLGAKLVEQKTVQRTATEASMENSSETSILSSAAKNVSDAYEKALGWAGLFVGETGEIKYELNTDFDIHRLSAQDALALLALWQGESLTFEEFRSNLKRAGIAFEDDEEARDKIALENPTEEPTEIEING